jgi:DNA invertase Pin-like site-specific DNA recombinase
MKKAVIYARHEDEAEIKKQLSLLKRYAKKNNYQIVAEFYDNSKKRPNKEEMFSYLHNNPEVKTILITTIERLTRSIIEPISLLRQGFQIITIKYPMPENISLVSIAQESYLTN